LPNPYLSLMWATSSRGNVQGLISIVSTPRGHKQPRYLRAPFPVDLVSGAGKNDVQDALKDPRENREFLVEA
jgi:hypothetical protein